MAAAKWLALPIVTLLFLQWPLRTVLGLYSREANDLGQWLFALYVAASITAATRARKRISLQIRYRGIIRTRHGNGSLGAGALLGLIPWSIIVLVTSWPIVRDSMLLFERFPDTGNPGYFIVKIALLLLASLILIEGVIGLFQPDRTPQPQ